MRLYSTLSRQLEELPPPPGPIRMYFCGPTVYQRAHIGNARPFILGMWLRAWLRHRGYDVKLVHNITDVNDKIYDAAPGASAELAARASDWYIEDVGDLGLGLPDALPRATAFIPQIDEFEIHGGGLDLVFPHHENELAQSSALGHSFARIWAHNGMLEFSGEKMSKSLGNDVSIRNVIDTWGREVVLLYYLSGHWRKPIDFNDTTLEQAKSQLDSFRNVFVGADSGAPVEQERLVEIVDDDFNTPEAL